MTSLARLALARGVQRLLDGVHNNPGSNPGAAIGVVQAGELVVHRCAGLASLELGVPIGPETSFRVASVTKQFTCAAVLMLAAEGRLRLEDDVRAHLPEFPDMGALVTVAHLLHNSSGVRDMLGIMRQGGADLGQPVRPDELMAGILRQRTLNFEPGSRFLYSNSNFLLLGRIAERVSGEPLRAFLDRRVFVPAGMSRTHLVEQVGEVVSGLATGYFRRDGAWVRAPHAFPLHGEGGLVSCVEDLALWSRWLDANPDLADALATQAPFSNGAVNLYARGQVVRDYRGVRTVGHGGLWPGYRTEFLRAPAEDITVIVIANRADADPNLLAHQVLDLLLDARPGAAPAPALARSCNGRDAGRRRSAGRGYHLHDIRPLLRALGASRWPAWHRAWHGLLCAAARGRGHDRSGAGRRVCHRVPPRPARRDAAGRTGRELSQRRDGRDLDDRGERRRAAGRGLGTGDARRPVAHRAGRGRRGPHPHAGPAVSVLAGRASAAE